jgi:hypothetical protein
MARIKTPTEGTIRYYKKKPTKSRKQRPDGYQRRKPRK